MESSRSLLTQNWAGSEADKHAPTCQLPHEGSYKVPAAGIFKVSIATLNEGPDRSIFYAYVPPSKLLYFLLLKTRVWLHRAFARSQGPESILSSPLNAMTEPPAYPITSASILHVQDDPLSVAYSSSSNVGPRGDGLHRSMLLTHRGQGGPSRRTWRMGWNERRIETSLILHQT